MFHICTLNETNENEMRRLSPGYNLLESNLFVFPFPLFWFKVNSDKSQCFEHQAGVTVADGVTKWV